LILVYIELIFLHHIHPHLSRHSLIFLAWSLVNQGCTAADRSFRNHLSPFLDNYTSFLPFLLGDDLVAFLITPRRSSASTPHLTLTSHAALIPHLNWITLAHQQSSSLSWSTIQEPVFQLHLPHIQNLTTNLPASSPPTSVGITRLELEGSSSRCDVLS